MSGLADCQTGGIQRIRSQSMKDARTLHQRTLVVSGRPARTAETGKGQVVEVLCRPVLGLDRKSENSGRQACRIAW